MNFWTALLLLVLLVFIYSSSSDYRRETDRILKERDELIQAVHQAWMAQFSGMNDVWVRGMGNVTSGFVEQIGKIFSDPLEKDGCSLEKVHHPPDFGVMCRKCGFDCEVAVKVELGKVGFILNCPNCGNYFEKLTNLMKTNDFDEIPTC